MRYLKKLNAELSHRIVGKWSVCKAAIFKFPAKQYILLKTKEMCHLEHKTPEQMPLKFLRYLI